MSTLTKEWLQKTIAELEEERDAVPGVVNVDVAMVLAAMKLALASLEAEAVGEVVLGEYDDCGCHPDARVACIAADGQADWENFKDGTRLYNAPPAPVSVPDDIPDSVYEVLCQACGGGEKACDFADELWNACREAMLQGADNELQRKAAIHDALCEKYNAESLADFVEWQRNHIAELEAAPPAPVGEGEMAVMPDYPGYAMTQRECYQAGKSAGLADPVTTAYTLPDDFDFDRFNDVVWLEAVASNPHMHSPTTSTIAMVALELNKRLETGNSPVIPDGWVIVPAEPTAEMLQSGISAHYDRNQIQIHERPAPGPMECAYVAMLAAAPQQEVK